MKYRYLFLLPFILLLQQSNISQLKSFNLNQLSGTIHLTLKNAVWKEWENKPVYQNITLDLVCQRGKCDSEVWGYAPKFNQDVDHQGILTQNNLISPHIKLIKTKTALDAWQLQVVMNIQSHPWNNETKEAIYNIEILPINDKLIGNYYGQFKGQFLQGNVKGNLTPLWPVSIPNHRPISAQEHPRLIFRQDELSSLRKFAQTPTGKLILSQLKKSLNQPIYYDGYVPTGGYHATGHCFLALLNNNQTAAETGWELVKKSLENPGDRLLERSPVVAGVALAYDLCYPLWSDQQIREITRWLAGQTAQLIKGDSPNNGWNNNAASNWNARARGAAGLSALAILKEPSLTNHKTQHFITVAERNLKRYFTTAIGDYGLGSEGDHYTTEPLVLTVFPFIQAYKNVMGKDLSSGSPVQWILPHYVMRMVEKNHQLKIATYGRHRYYAGGSLFSMGLGTVPRELLPGIIGVFADNLGNQGNQTFGINRPEQAPFIFAHYHRHQNQQTQNPMTMFGHVLVDRKKGFYNFRNQWKNHQDFVANIYLKRQLKRGAWHFPDVGSFRIWGLGEQWAKAGNSEGKWQEENVVILPNLQPWKTSKPIMFKSNPDGSGTVSLQTNTTWLKKEKSPVGIANLRAFAVDYSQRANVPGLFVVVDRFIHKISAEEFKEKVWIMHTAGQVTLGQNTFIIQGKNASTMKGTFIAPTEVKLSSETTKEGTKIMATGGDNFFVIMTVQTGDAPKLNVTGSGLNAKVKIGTQQIYFDRDRLRLSSLNP